MITNRFDRAIQALITAFFNGTLAKGSCSACAVGNIVAAGYNCKIEVIYDKENDSISFQPANKNISTSRWSHLFCTGKEGQIIEDIDNIKDDYNEGNERFKRFWDSVFNNIDVTGYSIEELAKVEYTFETNTTIKHYQYKNSTKEAIMEDQYKGLIAVFNVLCEIEGKDPTPFCKMLEYNSELQPINH